MKNYYIGVMSGTSLDGVDLALMDFSQHSSRLITADCIPMPQKIRGKLTDLLQSEKMSLQQFGELDHQLGLLYAKTINEFLQKYKLNPKEIQAIGCHGQTVWHSPNSPYPFTMQIGDMNLVAAKTGITVIADFRRKDMAYGGQGAPLVPAFHEEIFTAANRVTVVLNIGGISNISLLIPGQPTIGYDVGPGNALLDSWIKQQQNKDYDKNAEWAKTGQVNQQLLNQLLEEPFFSQIPPKSTGRELFNLTWLKNMAEKALINPTDSLSVSDQFFGQHKKQNTLLATDILPAQDIQRTLVELTAQSIANAVLNILNPTHFPCLLLVCGGGARNPLIMERLSALLPDWQVSTTSQYGLDIDYVEAAAFAWLAYRRICNLTSNLPSVTGAKSAVSLGVIFPAK